MKKTLLPMVLAVLLLAAGGCSKTEEHPSEPTPGPVMNEEQVSAETAPVKLGVSDLQEILNTLDLTDATLTKRTETEAAYPAKAAIRAERYQEELKRFTWKEYAPPEEWDRTDDFYYQISADNITITAFQNGYRGDRPLHLVTEAGEGWFILPYIAGASNESAVQLRQMAYETFLSWYAESETAAQCGRGGTPLTAEELDDFAEYTASDHTEYVEEHGGYYETGATEISCFFTSLYNDPRDMDAVEFLYYCPDQGILELEDEAEWQLVQRKKDWRFGEDNHLATIGELPVPVHRLPRTYINEILTKYAGITVEEMHTDWLTEALYIPETDCFYTFSSDFGPGSFIPCYGEKDGDIVTLWTAPDDTGSARVLTLQKSEDGWRILSHVKTGD